MASDAPEPAMASAVESRRPKAGPFVWLRLGLFVVVAAAISWRWLGGGDVELDDYGPVPAFTLTNQRGEPVGPDDLHGHAWAANFVFTRCATVCPLLTAKFANLQKRLADVPGLRFVSISVDPEHDTPEVLARYAARYEADPERWWFLTGSLEAIEQTVVKGFKVFMGDPEPNADDPGLVDIMHGEHVVLVDAQGRIRGYFRADAEGLQALSDAMRQLADR